RNLTDLKTDSYLDRPGADLSRLGLMNPAVKLEFWQKDQKEGSPAALDVGGTDGKGKVAMKDRAWPSILMVDGAAWKTVLDQSTKVARESGKVVAKASPVPSTVTPPKSSPARTPGR